MWLNQIGRNSLVAPLNFTNLESPPSPAKSMPRLEKLPRDGVNTLSRVSRETEGEIADVTRVPSSLARLKTASPWRLLIRSLVRR